MNPFGKYIHRNLSTEECLEILGLSGRVSRKDIKKAFRKRVRACHPDMHPDKPDAETELKLVLRAYHVLYDRYSIEHFEDIDNAFRSTGHGRRTAEARFVDAPSFQDIPNVSSPVLLGMITGLAAGLIYVLASGGLRSLGDIPAPFWTLSAFTLAGGLLFGLFAAYCIGRVKPPAYIAFVTTGMTSGAIVAVLYILALDAFTLDPAKAWSLLTFAAAGGMAAGSHVMLRQ